MLAWIALPGNKDNAKMKKLKCFKNTSITTYIKAKLIKLSELLSLVGFSI